jgi:hypothetical protein
VLLSAYIDESGIGGQPRVMLGALVARASRWHGFNWGWRKLLRSEGIPFSHLVDMENGDPPFEGWGKSRCGPFVGQAFRLVNKHLEFGLTAVLGVDDYQTAYRVALPKRTPKDSAYGLCARAVIENIMMEARTSFGEDTRVNFVFEDNQHFEDARRIFNDLKAHVPEISGNMGTITAGEKRDFPGLQASDLIASLGRRAEPNANFQERTSFGSARTPRAHGNIPIFHIDLHEKRIYAYGLQATDIAGEKRWARAKRKKAKKAAGS